MKTKKLLQRSKNRSNIKFKRQNKKNEWNRKKNKNADETLEIIKKILDENKDAQKKIQLAPKVDKGKSELKLKKNIAEKWKDSWN